MKRLFLPLILIASPLFSMSSPYGLIADKDENQAFKEMCSFAAASGKLSWLKTLKNAMAIHASSVSQPDAQGATPLFLACQEGHTEVVEFLIYRLQAEATKELFLLRADGEKIPCTALHMAAAKGHTKIAKRLIQAGARIYSQHAPKKQTPLHYAAAKGHTEIIALFLAEEANLLWLDGEDNSALSLIEKYGHKAALIKTIDEKKLLIDAAQQGSVKLVAQLIALNVDLEVTEPMCDATPLMCAVSGGHGWTVELLVNAGANILAKNNIGHTPLDCAKNIRSNRRIATFLEEALKKSLHSSKGKEEAN